MSGTERLKELISQPESQKFLRENLKENVPKLMLKYAGDADTRLLVQQIASRQKVRKKLPEWYTNLNLIFPPSLNLEQSSSELTARFKAAHFQGNSFTDLTAGFGVDAYYLGLSFAERIINEPAAELRTILKHNFRKLDFAAEIKGYHTAEIIDKLPRQDLIYLDPSRRNPEKGRVLKIEDYEPRIYELEQELLHTSEVVLVKVSPMVSIPEIQRKLQKLHAVWILAVRNEVKEILLVLKNSTDEHVRLQTWNLYDLQHYQYFESYADLPLPQPQLAAADKWIYEPNAAIFKGSLMDGVAAQFQLQKLHPQSHLYTSAHLHKSYPGRIFELESIHKPKDPQLQKGRYNIIARNYPQNALEIEKRLQTKPAKSAFLLATTLSDGSAKLLKTKLYRA